jgi:hypothetical protein
LARARADKEMMERRSFMGRLGGLFSGKPDVSSTRKASRPPVPIIPKPVNEAAGIGAATPAPPQQPSEAAGDGSTGVGVEIVSRPESNTGSNASKPPLASSQTGTEEKK